MSRTKSSSGDSNSGYVATPLLVTYMSFTSTQDEKMHQNLVLTRMLPWISKLHGTGIPVFADNYFSSHTLAAVLHDQGMNFVGVVRKDRKGLPSFKDDKKMQRRANEMFYCKEENLMAAKWIDNRSVHVISSIINSDMSSVERRVKG